MASACKSGALRSGASTHTLWSEARTAHCLGKRTRKQSRKHTPAAGGASKPPRTLLGYSAAHIWPEVELAGRGLLAGHTTQRPDHPTHERAPRRRPQQALQVVLACFGSSSSSVATLGGTLGDFGLCATAHDDDGRSRHRHGPIVTH